MYNVYNYGSPTWMQLIRYTYFYAMLIAYNYTLSAYHSDTFPFSLIATVYGKGCEDNCQVTNIADSRNLWHAINVTDAVFLQTNIQRLLSHRL